MDDESLAYLEAEFRAARDFDKFEEDVMSGKLGKIGGGGSVMTYVAKSAAPKVSRAEIDRVYPGCYGRARLLSHRQRHFGERHRETVLASNSLWAAVMSLPTCPLGETPEDDMLRGQWALDIIRRLVRLADEDGVA